MKKDAHKLLTLVLLSCISFMSIVAQDSIQVIFNETYACTLRVGAPMMAELTHLTKNDSNILIKLEPFTFGGEQAFINRYGLDSLQNFTMQNPIKEAQPMFLVGTNKTQSFTLIDKIFLNGKRFDTSVDQEKVYQILNDYLENQSILKMYHYQGMISEISLAR